MKNSIKIYIIFSLLVIAALIVTIFKMQNNNPDSKIYKRKMKELTEKLNFQESIIAADVLIYSENNPDEAIKLLQSLDNSTKHSGLIQAKINGYVNYAQALKTNSENENSSPKSFVKDENNKRYDNLLATNKKVSDSLLNQIAELKSQLIQNKKNVSAQNNVQVLAFKGVRGDKIHYIGEVKDNKAYGSGVGIWVTGSIYKGEWKNNIRHGEGSNEWPDGEKYVGSYIDGKRKGFGKYYWPNGERYEGHWVDDKRNGKGTLFDQDGNIRFDGNWVDDKPIKK